MGNDLYMMRGELCKHGYYKTGCDLCKAEAEEAKKPCPHGNPKKLCVPCLEEKIKRVTPVLNQIAELELEDSKLEQELEEKRKEILEIQDRKSKLFFKIRELKKLLED